MLRSRAPIRTGAEPRCCGSNQRPTRSVTSSSRAASEPAEPAAGLGDAHIHGPLPGTGIAVDLETELVQAGTADVFVAQDCVAVDAGTLDAILANPELFYVNVHTAEFPGGAIQGTLA